MWSVYGERNIGLKREIKDLNVRRVYMNNKNENLTAHQRIF